MTLPILRTIVAIALFFAIARPATAQVCGDADGSGAITATDGVAILREAAELESACVGRTCDIDGDGDVTVVDGVATLRRAAQLPIEISCGTRFGELVKTVLARGIQADLRLGLPPSPAPGAPQDVVSIDGVSQVQPGQVANFILQLARQVESLLIAFQENGVVVEGFAVLPIGGDGAPVELQLTVGSPQGGITSDLKVASVVGGELGGFQTQQLVIGPGSGSGLVVVASDEWPLSDAGFARTDGSEMLISNIARVFARDTTGTFHGYSSNFGLTGTTIGDVLASAGHVWTSGIDLAFDLPTLRSFDGVFLAGTTPPVDFTVLTEYVASGGNVFIVVGTSSGAGAVADYWGPFLSAYGLELERSASIARGGRTIEITSSHEILNGVQELFIDGAQGIIDTTPSDGRSQVIAVLEGKGLFGVYQSD